MNDTPGNAPIVELEAITKAYPGVVASDRVTIDLRPGEIHAIVGENGAGKTTLMAILNGFTQPDSGRIVIDGSPVEMASPREALALGLGYVQQHFSLIPTLSVAENLILSLSQGGERIGRRQGAERVQELGTRFGLTLEPEALLEDLTVGEQQRAELLKALARDARVLCLDEPNALLTPQEWLDLEQTLRELVAAGVGMFLISHKLDEVLRLADRISVMRRGRLVATVKADATDASELARLMVGELISEAPTQRPSPVGEKVTFSASDLVIAGDRGEVAVEGVGFEIHAGEVLGVAGVEGSGQVELTEALCGGRQSMSGRVQVAGQDVSSLGVKARMARGLGHVPADRRNGGLVADLSVAENLVLPFIDSPAFSRRGITKPGAITEYAEKLIADFDIRVASPDFAVDTLSGGNQQKVVLARELSRDLTALVCCYPTWGLDFAAAAAVKRQILALRGNGVAILYASVELDELLDVSDRILVLNRGRAVGILSTQEATAEKLGLLMGGRDSQ